MEVNGLELSLDFSVGVSLKSNRYPYGNYEPLFHPFLYVILPSLMPLAGTVRELKWLHFP